MGNKSTLCNKQYAVNKYVGTAYDTVKKVSDNIEDVSVVADALGEDFPDGGLANIADNLDQITVVEENIGDVSTVAENILEVVEVADNIDAVLDVPNQAELARKWAQEAEDVEVLPGEYSAYHYANKAEEQADRAETEVDTLSNAIRGEGYFSPAGGVYPAPPTLGLPYSWFASDSGSVGITAWKEGELLQYVPNEVDPDNVLGDYFRVGGINSGASAPINQPRQYGDGVTTTFAVPDPDGIQYPSEVFHVFFDGLRQLAGTDYNITDVGVIEFTEAPPLLVAIDITLFAPKYLADDISLGLVTATGSTTPRLLSERFADVVNVKDFGAKGDGVTNDTVALQRAFTSIQSSNKRLVIDSPCVFDETLTIISTDTVDVEFKGGGELICTADIDVGVWISGLPYVTDNSVYWDPLLRENPLSITTIEEGARSITLTAGHGLVKGDWLRIASSEQHTPLRTQYIKGEMHQVQRVEGDVIHLDSAVFDTYNSSITWVFKLAMPSVRLHNWKMSGQDDGNDTRGLVLWECADVLIEEPRIYGFNDQGLSPQYCVDLNITKPTMNFASKEYVSASRTSYGLVLSSCQSVNITGGTLKGGRHSFSTGGYDPCRFITVNGTTIMSNDVDDLDVAAMDSHENIVGLNVINCTIFGGANLAGQDINFLNNKVIITEELLRAVEFRPAISCNYINASGNSVQTDAEAAGGIVIRQYAENVGIRKVTTSDNVVVLNTAYPRRGIGFEPVQAEGHKVELWECRGNQITLNSTNPSSVCISNWDGGDITKRPDIVNGNISGNYLFNSLGACLDIRQKDEGRIGNITVTDNNMISREYPPFSLIWCKDIYFNNNTVSGDEVVVTEGRANQVRYSDNFTWSNSTISYSDYRGCRLRDIDNIQEINIRRVECTDTSVEYNNTVSPTAHSWGQYSFANDSVTVANNCSISQNGVTGRYLVQWAPEDRHSNEFFTMSATVVGNDGYAYCVPNNYLSCFVFCKDINGNGLETDFSFISY